MYNPNIIVLREHLKKPGQCPSGSKCAYCPAGTNIDVLDGYSIEGYPLDVVRGGKNFSQRYIRVKAIDPKNIGEIIQELKDKVHPLPTTIRESDATVPFNCAVLYHRSLKRMIERPWEIMYFLELGMFSSETKEKE